MTCSAGMHDQIDAHCVTVVKPFVALRTRGMCGSSSRRASFVEALAEVSRPEAMRGPAFSDGEPQKGSESWSQRPSLVSVAQCRGLHPLKNCPKEFTLLFARLTDKRT